MKSNLIFIDSSIKQSNIVSKSINDITNYVLIQPNDSYDDLIQKVEVFELQKIN